MPVSLIPANIEVLAFGIQDDKDTPATDPVIAVALEDESLDPGVQKITTPETDASAQTADQVVVGSQPGGTFKKYVRPSEEDFFLYSLLGHVVDGGTTPKIHTADIDASAPFSSPYLTVWQVWPGVATIQYNGVRIAQAAFSSQPGGAVEVEYTLVGLEAVLGVDEPDLSGLIADELAFTWPELTVTLGGVHGGVVNRFALTINRNTGRFAGDNGLISLDVPNGLLAVTGSFNVAFLDDELLRAANTGTIDGTALTTTIFSESIVLDLARGADLETKFLIAGAQISNFKAQANTDGSPAIASFDFNSKRQATLSDAIQTVVKNAITHADRS